MDQTLVYSPPCGAVLSEVLTDFTVTCWAFSTHIRILIRCDIARYRVRILHWNEELF